jgi:hypothetical protein
MVVGLSTEYVFMARYLIKDRNKFTMTDFRKITNRKSVEGGRRRRRRRREGNGYRHDFLHNKTKNKE